MPLGDSPEDRRNDEIRAAAHQADKWGEEMARRSVGYSSEPIDYHYSANSFRPSKDVSRPSRPTVIAATARISVVAGLLNLVGGITMATRSTLMGSLGNTATAFTSGLLSVLGFISMVIGIMLIVDAIGLTLRKPWSWMMTLRLYGIYLVLTVLGWLINSNFNILSLGFAVISGAIVYLFYTRADIKRALGRL